MAANPSTPPPSWTRRLPGWSFLAFFVSLIILTFLAVEAWNAGDLVMTGYLAGLASVVPLLAVIVVYYALPVWGISVPIPPVVVADTLAAAAHGRSVEPVAERDGPFSRCVAVVRFEDPACTVGWSADPSSPRAGLPHEVSLIVLRPETRDRRALASFREKLARCLLDASQASA